jgi:hypothetical protein
MEHLILAEGGWTTSVGLATALQEMSWRPERVNSVQGPGLPAGVHFSPQQGQRPATNCCGRMEAGPERLEWNLRDREQGQKAMSLPSTPKTTPNTQEAGDDSLQVQPPVLGGKGLFYDSCHLHFPS